MKASTELSAQSKIQRKVYIRLDLKVCWFGITWVCFFKYTWPVGKNFFNHFEMGKIALIVIYNIFMTKKNFFRYEHQKKILTHTFSCRPSQVMANQHIFKSGLSCLSHQRWSIWVSLQYLSLSLSCSIYIAMKLN